MAHEGVATLDPIYQARPTLRFGGEPDVRASNLVESMMMEEGEGGLRALELELSNWVSTRDGGAEPAFDDGSVMRLGADIEVYSGEVDRPRELFRGVITAIEQVFQRGQPPLLRLCAEDALLAARLARRSRVYTDQSPADIVNTIAGELGLQAVVTALAGPVQTWSQIDETDLAFLRRLLARFDADLQVVGRELHVSPRADVERGRVSLDVDSDLHRISVCADLAEQVTAVQTRGWDAAAGSVVRAEVEQGSNLGPGSGRDGATVLRDAIGERADNLGHCAVHSQEQAQALAEAAFDHRARRFVRANGVTEGNPNLRVGTRLTLTGLGTRFDNDYYVVSSRHIYDLQDGYRTEFSAECAYLGGTA
jgi:phage protein D